MNKKRNSVLLRQMACHGKVLAKGFVRATFGALTAGLAAVACYTFAGIPGESGYVAVGDFVGALATTIVALACMYIMGGRKRIR